MKVLTGIAVLAASVALAGCSSQVAVEGEMKPAATEASMTMAKDAGMTKGEGCHNHAANSMTKSMEHCHKGPSGHNHKYGGHAGMKKSNDGMMKKDAGMMKQGAGCHNHAANSMTKSMQHCHKGPAGHGHKYGR